MARKDPHSYTDLEQGVIERVDWRLRVEFETKRLRAGVTLFLREPAEGPLDLDTRDLEILEVASPAHGRLKWTLAEPEGFLGRRLTVEMPADTRAIDIQYRTGREASALQWLEPAQTAGGQHPYLFSQCQPHHARSMLPIQDSPQVRFTYAAKVTVPNPLKVVMSAAPGPLAPGCTTGTTAYRFSMPQPIPSYLLALAVGALESRDLGPRTRVYAEAPQLEAAAWEFADAEKMLESAEELFGPYLWDRFDFLVMPPAFPYGGMENPRLTFLTPTLLAGDRSMVNVLTHELAHSWTGNLVTNATMNDFWLNEGFTVWAERRILEKLEGQEAVSLAAAIGRNGLDSELARFGADSPLTRLENDLWGVDPDEVYSLVPYEKGCLFVTLLEQTVGRERFDAFLKDYIQRFRFTSLDTATFEAYLDERLPGLRAQVDAEAWIHGPGIPDSAPRFHSARLEALQALGDAWKKGERPTFEQARAWTADDWQIYLPRLPRPLSEADCAWLDENFDLTKSGNSEVLSQWLVIAAASSYAPAYARIRSFLGSVGRMKYLKPLYAALHKNPATRPLAAEILAESASGYHPIARAALQGALQA